MVQDADFFLCLSVEALLVSDHLEGDADAILVVVSMNDLSKTAFAENFEHLVAVRNVIVWHLQPTNQKKLALIRYRQA